MIPYGRQSISDDDIQAVVNVLKSDWLTQGPAVGQFENTVARYCGAAYAVAVNSATSALHSACLAAGLGPGDILWTSPITFVASANCGIYCGATVDFVDIDPLTYNMSSERLQEKLEQAKRTGKLPKVVIPVHFAGQPCDMAAMADLAKSYGFRIIEDASHAIGARYKGEPVGSCRYSDMTVFSFHPVKIITTGEGGMILTNNSELHDKLARLRSHGITRDPALMTEVPHGPWYYQQIELGFNYRMTDIQAALGMSQMARLDEFIARRHELAQRYDGLLSDLSLILPGQSPKSYSAYHLYVITVDACVRRAVFDRLKEEGICVNVHYIPVHTQPYFKSRGFSEGMFPESERYYSGAISLPMYPDMSNEQQHRVIDVVRKFVR